MKIIDITTAYNALISLERWLNVYGEEILKYINTMKENYSNYHFIEYFDINDDLLLSSDLSLVSLHVTTNDDNCFSLKEYGLRNLQDSIVLNTPLSRYLKDHQVQIDLIHKQIHYKNKLYDISSWQDGFSLSQIEKSANYVHRKIYRDHQINGFLSHKNILNYGGGVRRRPEFLETLSKLLCDQSIEKDWEKKDNRCYVLKYIADISKFAYFTFEVDEYDREEYKDEPNQIELLKRKWLLGRALTVLFNNMFGYSLPEIPSYMNPDVIVPYNDIIKIYTHIEYLKEHNILSM